METKKRNSSLELLRIICMIFIIFHHYSVHGNFIFQDGLPIESNELFLKFMSLFGKVACNIFILITGYFLINSKINVKKIIKLIIKLYVYNFLILIFVYTTKITNISKGDFLLQCNPIYATNWFVVDYIILYCLAPFLNIVLNKLDKQHYIILLTILIAFFSVITTLNENFWGISGIDIFIVMYVIGAYMGRFSKETNEDNIKNLVLGLLFLLLLVFFSMFFFLVGNKLNIYGLIKMSEDISDIYSIFAVLASIFIFKYFKNCKFYSNFINYIATSMLGVYLIHDNSIVRKIIWKVIFPNAQFQSSPYLIIHFICKCSIVFIGCVIIDKIISAIIKVTFDKLVDKHIDIKSLSSSFNKFSYKIDEIFR